MNNQTSPLLILMAILFSAGCTVRSASTSDSDATQHEVRWPYAVSYEVFVRAFADGNNDGIGDLRGLTGKLDYLQDLGVKALWLMPISPSPSYHKYDVTDYKAIHADYGTMADFEHFLAEAHRRDIKVVLDLVINHTSSRHPWFTAALADRESPYFDFYVWENAANIESMTVTQTGPDSDNLRRWNPVDAYDDTYFYAYFWSGMPDLNFDNRAVRDTIYDIGRFWLEKGVDGFRLDAAKHIFPDERAIDNHRFWDEFRAEMERVNPDVLLVGEVWAPTEIVKPYLTGLRSLFNFDLGYAILDAVKSGNGSALAAQHATILNEYLAVTEDFVDATFLTNHDQNRVMSELDGDQAKARVAASILLTLPGSPYLYYGEEIGMTGRKPDQNIREPMLWEPEPDAVRSRWRTPSYSTDATIQTVAQQLADPGSLLHHYRTLIHLRNASPALTYGGIRALESPDPALVVFTREHALESLIVIHNVSAEVVTISYSDLPEGYRDMHWSSATADAAVASATADGAALDSSQATSETLTLLPFSTVMLTAFETP